MSVKSGPPPLIESGGGFCQCCELTVDKLHRFCVNCLGLSDTPVDTDYGAGSLVCAHCYMMFHPSHLPRICVDCWKKESRRKNTP